MTMMPGVQIVNMRPTTPTAPAQQKTVATVSPRVVIGSSHVVGARPGQTNSVCVLLPIVKNVVINSKINFFTTTDNT